VTNISSRVTATQLASFFSKFGPVNACQIPLESSGMSDSSARFINTHATMPRPKRAKAGGLAYVTFRTPNDAEAAKCASADDLKFYDKTMVVTGVS
jgi:RNA recognition motif-containing protein